MSQRTIDSTDSDASVQPSVNGAGISLVPPGSGGHLPADTPAVYEVGPRFSEWLPDLHEAILPTVVRTVRKLAFEYDPRVLTKQRRFLFPQECLHQKHDVGGWGYSYQEAVAKYALHYADTDPDELRENERHAYDYLKASLTGIGTGHNAVNTGLDVLDETVVPLLEASNSPPPTVVLYLDGPAWSDIEDERTVKRALDALSTMGTVCDLRLVCSPQLESHIERNHPEWYDEHLTEAGDATQAPAPNETSESALTTAWEIIGGFASGGGRLRLLAALLVGRPATRSHLERPDDEERRAYRERQREAISSQLERYNPDAPVVFDLDFGHTNPTAPLPIGERVIVDPSAERIVFE